MQPSEGTIQAAEPGAVPVEPVEEPSIQPAPAKGDMALPDMVTSICRRQPSGRSPRRADSHSPAWDS